jgi:glycosyltransferase involved in cell wall biosynthesis
MKVLALTSYPVEAAATRFRLQQFVEPLAHRGIELTIRPFVDSKLFPQLYRHGAWFATAVGLSRAALSRLAHIAEARQAEVLLIQREAMMFGPPMVEWISARLMKRPMVLDLDDATYVSYVSPTYGNLGKILKWAGKTDDLIGWAALVTCGNRSIAEYVTTMGGEARFIPTVVDTDIFAPLDRDAAAVPVLGWIGTHSTFPYLESIFPVLSSLAKEHEFRLKIVGAGRDDVSLPGVEIENLPWTLAREVVDFQSIDVGLYPIDISLYSGKWAQGKSGFKAVQYMAVGVPYVATPVGGSAEIGEAGETHFFASTEDEWYRSLKTLLVDADQRRQMGAAGRRHAIEHYGLQDQADKLEAALREAAQK